MKGVDDWDLARHAALRFPPAAGRVNKLCFLSDGTCLDDMGKGSVHDVHLVTSLLLAC